MIVTSRRVVLPDGVKAAAIQIADGRIVAIGPELEPEPGETITDAGNLLVLPGLVDTHVHINEPGRTEWEGFASATRAAAAGGVTTLVDMPLNSVPSTTNVGALAAKRRAAERQIHVDVGFWGGAVPGNAADLEPLAAAGVRGFKCFLSPSGVDEFEHVGEADLREAMPIVAALGLPLLVHAEWPAALRSPRGERRRYSTWLDSRPDAAEVAAIERLTQLAAEYGTRLHIVHLACGAALAVLRASRASGAPVSVETCPHYLTFAAEEIADGDTRFKCAPPIRPAVEREVLWDALLAGDVDLVATDHSPAPPELKRFDDGDFVAAWGGIASLQLGLRAVWTGAYARGASAVQIAQWMAAAPARLAGLYPRKGVVAVGSDADLVIFDPDAESVVDQAALFHRHPATPYHGRSLRGRVRTTIVRGRVVYDDGACGSAAMGRLL
jgi:allantoinase